MTEKRFTFNIDSDWWTISDTTTNDERLWGQDVVDLLNELAEENKDNKAMIEFLNIENNQIMNELKTRTQIQHQLEEENEQLKAQLYCDSNEGVCSICKHHYLEKTNMFYISKCEKGHEKCSKESVRHCEDFKLKELQE